MFAEARFPLIGGDRRLELSVADRYEHYSDFGSTNNPQFGLRWEPRDGLALRGTYGTSFVAPLLKDLNPVPAQVVAFPTSAFPGSAPPSGDTNVLVVLGGNPDLDAQTAQTWTAGLDWLSSARSLRLHFTYYGARFEDRIATLSQAGISPIFALPNVATLGSSIVDLDPSAALIERLLSATNLLVFPGTDTANIGAVVHAESLNLSSVDTDGLDLDISYRPALASVDAEVGAAATYILSFKTRFTDNAPARSLVNTLHNPPRLKARLRAVLQRGVLSGAAFVNYTNSYEDVLATPVASIDSWTTVDVSLSYDCARCPGLLKDSRATLSVTNLTNEDPPFVQRGAGVVPFFFDGNNANPLKRFVSMQLTKRL